MSSCRPGLSSRAFGLIVKYSRVLLTFSSVTMEYLRPRGGSDSHCIDLCKIELQGIVFLSAPFEF